MRRMDGVCAVREGRWMVKGALAVGASDPCVNPAPPAPPCVADVARGGPMGDPAAFEKACTQWIEEVAEWAETYKGRDFTPARTLLALLTRLSVPGVAAADGVVHDLWYGLHAT